MKKTKAWNKIVTTNRQGFTLIELLLVMTIVGILSAVIFISVGNQRQKAKLNAVLQTARGPQAVAQECYFRKGAVNLPNDLQNPTNEICQHSKTIWTPITVDECQYSGGISDQYYEIRCPAFGKSVRCGIRSGGKCEII